MASRITNSFTSKIPEGAGGFSPLIESEFAGPLGPGFSLFEDLKEL
jgi:hypothetical protein